MDQQATDRLYRKVTLRIIPFVFVLFVVNFLDRANIAFAALTQNATTCTTRLISHVDSCESDNRGRKSQVENEVAT